MALQVFQLFGKLWDSLIYSDLEDRPATSPENLQAVLVFLCTTTGLSCLLLLLLCLLCCSYRSRRRETKYRSSKQIVEQKNKMIKKTEDIPETKHHMNFPGAYQGKYI